LEHYRLVHSSEQRKLLVSFSRIDRQRGQVAGQSFFRSIGNLGGNQTINTYFALQRSPQYVVHEQRQAVAVKTFERVEGAELTGSAPAGANVTVSLTLNNTQTGTNFTYEQTARADEDGEFVVTVPYATNDAVSPSEGGTDSVIEADGVYTLNVEDGGITTVAVPESTVLDGESIEVDFSGAVNASAGDRGDGDDEDRRVGVGSWAAWFVDVGVRTV
jgi:dolichyl-diphosphooligosaccharide--protein glycosyltransferase